MDRERFDALARLLATTGSRRRAIGALVGAGLLGTGLEAEGKKRNKRGRDRAKSKGKAKGRAKRTQAEQVPANCCSTGNCTPGKGKNLGKCCYEDGNVSGKNFSGANLGQANFTNADATGANFQAANLGKACFVDANLTDARINGSTNLAGAVFCRTIMPDETENNSGCFSGTPCCHTCEEDAQCGDGALCCNGNCRIGDCCSNEDCEDPNEPVCIRNTCSGCTRDGQCGGDLTCCDPICTDTSTDEDNCGECARACEAGEICSNGFTCQDDACLPVTEIEGNVELAANGGLTLSTEGGIGYGAFAFGVPGGTTFAEIATMESTFEFSLGSCGAGTPRFCTIFTGRDDCVCAQFPTTLCDTEDTGSTGNLIGNNTSGVWFRLCAAGPTINTYAEALTEYGTEEIDYIFLVVDSSNGSQTVTVEPCITLVQPG